MALESSVLGVLKYLAMMAAGYNNHLKWNEEAKLKADLMNAPTRWIGVDAHEVRASCLQLGMRSEDADLVSGLVARAVSGRRLVPHRSYRTFQFNDVPPPPASREW